MSGNRILPMKHCAISRALVDGAIVLYRVYKQLTYLLGLPFWVSGSPTEMIALSCSVLHVDTSVQRCFRPI